MTKILEWIVKTLLGEYLKRASTLDFLANYKTYILGVAGVFVGVIGYLGGADLGGVHIPAMDGKAAIEVIWASLMAITIRKGIARGTKGG
jgi:hypothetical protein